MIDHMLEQLANAKRLKEMLGGYGDRIDLALDDIRKVLQPTGSDGEVGRPSPAPISNPSLK